MTVAEYLQHQCIYDRRKTLCPAHPARLRRLLPRDLCAVQTFSTRAADSPAVGILGSVLRLSQHLRYWCFALSLAVLAYRQDLQGRASVSTLPALIEDTTAPAIASCSRSPERHRGLR